MLSIINLLPLFLLQTLFGLQILGAFNLRFTRTITLCLSLFAGMFCHSLVFFCADLLHVPLTTTMVYTSACVGILALLPSWKSLRNLIAHLRAPSKHNLHLSDIPLAAFSGYVFYMILWASWYWPVTPFDAMAGIDLVAKHTVEEHTIVNRVFTDPSLRGQLSNQPFYAPFAMLMQVMMKLLGFAYNQVWVGVVSVVFSVFMWASLRRLLHPFVAGIVYLLYLLTPEMFGYTYLLQTDFVNAVFFTVGVYLFWQGTEQKRTMDIYASAVFFAAACWSRTESPLLIALGSAACAPALAKAFGRGISFRMLGVVGLACLTSFTLWHVLFFNAYLPVRPVSSEQLVGFDVSRFLGVVAQSTTNVIMRIDYWGVILWAAFACVALDLFINKTFRASVVTLWIIGIVLGLWISGTLFSAAIVEQTLRRGMFKIVPLAAFAIGATQLLTSASVRLTRWQSRRVS